jgi:prepilin-type N-terminal cleavage/methylation domain-containing protein
MRIARGFTLIELMIVVVVIAVLAAIAFPAYTNYIQRSKITEATSSLSELRLRAEKRFADNRAYTGFNTAIQNAKYFTYGCVVNANDFLCTATGVGNQAMGGFVYTINESNVRTSTFTGQPGWNNSTTCWVTKKGESC